MKRFLPVALALVAILSGCATKAAVAPVPGQINTFDAYAYRILADAGAALEAFKADVTSGKLTETPTIKTALNQAIEDYSAAKAAYQVWHAAGGTGSTDALTMQIGKVQGDIASVAGGAK